jgi:carboxyl-terminal processing protease
MVSNQAFFIPTATDRRIIKMLVRFVFPGLRKLARGHVPLFALLVTLCGGLYHPLIAQSLRGDDRDNGQLMLRAIKDDLKKHYFDVNIRGIDIDSRFKQAEDRIKKAQSNSEIMGIIAQILLELDDSHTFFVPPRRVARVEYGWQMKAVGDDCYVSAVKPGSDAAAKGIAVGDKVIALDGRPLSRDKVWLAQYLYYSLRPQPGMRLSIGKPDGKEQNVDVIAKVNESKKVLNFNDGTFDINSELRDAEDEDRLHRQRFYEIGDDTLIWKMPQFNLGEEQIQDIVGKFRNRKTLILDLRGNGGGYVKTLEWLAGYLFEQDVKIADLKGRKELKPVMAKGHGDRTFKGQLVVLIDGGSASAAEILARVVQLNKRGTVIGDRSAGKVMESRFYDHQIGIDRVIWYGAAVTEADVLMTDGKSLEHTGVTPDELILPTAADMSAGRDPVLARALALAGASLDSQKAGSLFPVEWKK